MRGNGYSERKSFRPRTNARLSEKEAREEFYKTKSLYVLGISSAYSSQLEKALAAKFGSLPESIYFGKPPSSALCVKVIPPCRQARLTDIRMQFFVV